MLLRNIRHNSKFYPEKLPYRVGVKITFYAKCRNMPFSQVQKIPNLAYQIYQTLQIYWVYEKDDIKYKYDRKWKTENMAEKHNFQE